MWFGGTADYCTIHLDNFCERLENEIAWKHMGRGEKVIYLRLQQITQLKDAAVLDDVDSQRNHKARVTKETSLGTFWSHHID